LVRLLAYQYRDLFDDQEYDQTEREKFKKFVKIRLGLDLDRELSQGVNKVIKFSYPDLEYHQVPEPLLGSLKEDFRNNFSGVTLNCAYVIYVRQSAPQIGFTASVAFEMTLDDANEKQLQKRFEREGSLPSPFHREFKKAWESQADKRQTLPITLFVDQVCHSWLFAREQGFGSQIFGAPEKVILSSGRSVLMERGFPYVSYVLHTDMNVVVSKTIHKCDFAILMALPGFVEKKLESIRKYRDKLREVQTRLENDEFRNAEKQYSKAWQDFELVQGLMPTTTAAVQRIKQKYPGKSVFAAIADDNTQLIQSTVNAAIEATEQVRANIQSFAQRRLQRIVNRQQSLTAFLTFILMAGALATAYMAVLGTTKTEISNISHIAQPIRVSSEPIPDESGTKASLKATLLFRPGIYPVRTEVPLEFRKQISEIPIVLPTPLAVAGSSPIELLVLGEDGAVLAEGSIAIINPPAAIQFSVDRKLFQAGRKYYLQVEQNSIWKIKLPIKVTFAR
jgi:hypothetical protein